MCTEFFYLDIAPVHWCSSCCCFSKCGSLITVAQRVQPCECRELQRPVDLAALLPLPGLPPKLVQLRTVANLDNVRVQSKLRIEHTKKFGVEVEIDPFRNYLWYCSRVSSRKSMAFPRQWTRVRFAPSRSYWAPSASQRMPLKTIVFNWF